MTSDGRLARMKDTIRDVWNSSCGNVYPTVQPTWDAFREYASATTEQIKMHLYCCGAIFNISAIRMLFVILYGKQPFFLGKISTTININIQ